MSPELSVCSAVRHYVDSLRASNRSQKTITAYSCDLIQFAALVGDVSVRDVLRATIDAWLLDLQENAYAAASIRRKMASVRQMFRYLAERGFIDESPLLGFTLRLGEERRLTRVVSTQDLRRLLVWLDDRVSTSLGRCDLVFVATRDRAIVRLLCATGMRVGELAALTTSHLLLDDDAIRLLGKGRRERMAYFSDDADKEHLRAYLRVRDERAVDHRLFITSHGTPLSEDGVRRMLREVADASGVQARITPHMLRHTAATRLLEHGADLRIVQVFLGHASIRSTERYTHVSQSHLKAVLRRCHPLLNVA